MSSEAITLASEADKDKEEDHNGIYIDSDPNETDCSSEPPDLRYLPSSRSRPSTAGRSRPSTADLKSSPDFCERAEYCRLASHVRDEISPTVTTEDWIQTDSVQDLNSITEPEAGIASDSGKVDTCPANTFNLYRKIHHVQREDGCLPRRPLSAFVKPLFEHDENLRQSFHWSTKTSPFFSRYAGHSRLHKIVFSEFYHRTRNTISPRSSININTLGSPRKPEFCLRIPTFDIRKSNSTAPMHRNSKCHSKIVVPRPVPSAPTEKEGKNSRCLESQIIELDVAASNKKVLQDFAAQKAAAIQYWREEAEKDSSLIEEAKSEGQHAIMKLRNRQGEAQDSLNLLLSFAGSNMLGTEDTKDEYAKQNRCLQDFEDSFSLNITALWARFPMFSVASRAQSQFIVIKVHDFVHRTNEVTATHQPEWREEILIHGIRSSAIIHFGWYYRNGPQSVVLGGSCSFILSEEMKHITSGNIPMIKIDIVERAHVLVGSLEVQCKVPEAKSNAPSLVASNQLSIENEVSSFRRTLNDVNFEIEQSIKYAEERLQQALEQQSRNQVRRAMQLEEICNMECVLKQVTQARSDRKAVDLSQKDGMTMQWKGQSYCRPLIFVSKPTSGKPKMIFVPQLRSLQAVSGRAECRAATNTMFQPSGTLFNKRFKNENVAAVPTRNVLQNCWCSPDDRIDSALPSQIVIHEQDFNLSTVIAEDSKKVHTPIPVVSKGDGARRADAIREIKKSQASDTLRRFDHEESLPTSHLASSNKCRLVPRFISFHSGWPMGSPRGSTSSARR